MGKGIKSGSAFMLLTAVISLVMLSSHIAPGYENSSRSAKKGFITVVDCVGRSVKVPEKINRIACLYLFAGDVVTMLGRGNDIVAVSNGLKRDSLLLKICPSIDNALVPKIQGAVNMEEILKADPDVLFIPDDISSSRGEMEELERFGIPTIIIDYSDMKSQQKAIRIIGRAIGRSKKAERYIKFYRKCIERAQAVTKDIPPDHRIKLYHSVNEATRTTIKLGLTADWLKVTGVINVALSSPMNILDGKNFVSIEQIQLWNPDVILVNEPEALKQITTDRKWSMINAVRNKRVYQMPIGITRWGHPGSMETPMAILWTVKELYPDRFKDLDMVKETRFFYKTFFNYDLSDKTVRGILSGKLILKPKYDSHGSSGKHKKKRGELK